MANEDVKTGYIKLPKSKDKFLPATTTAMVADTSKHKPLSETLSDIDHNMGVLSYPVFSDSKGYVIGDIVRYEDKLYEFKVIHTAGAFNLEEVQLVDIMTIVKAYVDSLDDAQRDLLASALMEYAKNKGYYQPMRVGSADTADNIRGKIAVVEEFYNKLINDGKPIEDGVGGVTTFVGNSVVFNEQIKDNTFKIIGGFWKIDTTIGSVERQEYGCKIHYLRAGDFSQNNLISSLKPNHTYYVSFEYKGNIESKYMLQLYPKNGDEGKNILFTATTEWKKINKKITLNNFEEYITTSFYHTENKECDLYLKYINIIDLTQMFGKDVAEIITIEEFEKLFPEPYYDYNEGEIINYTGTGIKSVGFNQYGLEQLKQAGYYDNITSRQLSQVPINVNWLPNTQYYIEINGNLIEDGKIDSCLTNIYYTDNTTDKFVLYIDKNKHNATYVTALNKTIKKIGFTYKNGSGKITIDKYQINISNPQLNGQYKPYKEFTRYIDITSIKNANGQPLFPNGLCSVGEVHDIITPYYAIKNIGTNDDGNYVLDVPIKVDFEQPINMDIAVENGGTLELLPEQGSTPTSAPAKLNIKYPINASGTVQSLPEQYISKESFSAYLSARNTIDNGTWEMTWDAEHGRYAFTFTPTPAETENV